MNIFISWSGDKSLNIANILKVWIPLVIQSAEIYVSSSDIEKGQRWSTDIATQLEKCTFGIICLTKDNLEKPWINFEAGALSKSVEKSYLCPLLFDLKPSDIDSNSPLLQFQCTQTNNKNDIFKLVETINNNSLPIIPKERLDISFEQWWPRLNQDLSKVEQNLHEDITKIEKEKHTDSTKVELSRLANIIEDLLDINRKNHQILRNPEELLPLEYIRNAFSITSKSINHDLFLIKRILKELLLESKNLSENEIRFPKDPQLIKLIDMHVKEALVIINKINHNIEEKDFFIRQKSLSRKISFE